MQENERWINIPPDSPPIFPTPFFHRFLLWVDQIPKQRKFEYQILYSCIFVYQYTCTLYTAPAALVFLGWAGRGGEGEELGGGGKEQAHAVGRNQRWLSLPHPMPHLDKASHVTVSKIL